MKTRTKPAHLGAHSYAPILTPPGVLLPSHVAGCEECGGGAAPRAHQVQPGQHRGEPVAGAPGEQRLQQGRPGEAVQASWSSRLQWNPAHAFASYDFWFMVYDSWYYGSWCGEMGVVRLAPRPAARRRLMLQTCLSVVAKSDGKLVGKFVAATMAAQETRARTQTGHHNIPNIGHSMVGNPG